MSQNTGVFEVTIQGALRAPFEQWVEDLGMVMVPFGDNEAGVPTHVLTIRPGSDLARRFEAMRRGASDG